MLGYPDILYMKVGVGNGVYPGPEFTFNKLKPFPAFGEFIYHAGV